MGAWRKFKGLLRVGKIMITLPVSLANLSTFILIRLPACSPGNRGTAGAISCYIVCPYIN